VSSTSVLRQQAVRDRLPRIVAGLLARPAVSVTADLPMAEAVRRAQEAHAQGIVIVDGEGQPNAVVREAQVLATPAVRRPWLTIGSVSHQVSGADLIPAAASGETLIRLLQSRAASEYIVVDPDGEVFGVLAAADVARALAGGKPAGIAGYAGTASPRTDQVEPDNLRA
jgi:CBS domain-containing protein